MYQAAHDDISRPAISVATDMEVSRAYDERIRKILHKYYLALL